MRGPEDVHVGPVRAVPSTSAPEKHLPDHSHPPRLLGSASDGCVDAATTVSDGDTIDGTSGVDAASATAVAGSDTDTADGAETSVGSTWLATAIRHLSRQNSSVVGSFVQLRSPTASTSVMHSQHCLSSTTLSITRKYQSDCRPTKACLKFFILD
ncbi:hypothetical protein OPT61_g1378 [Boeremia exigua]|uniref:Uncharacterized protein n=1 Tax=Boeremia exigua TaxID=749465 RepID=A0ACC2IQJ6_9PLEO|nr:hypothetical protein OPT61_g1378 [Boeremia exigua]